MRRWLGLVPLLVACGATPKSPPPAPTRIEGSARVQGAVAAEEAHDLFERLVALVRRYHVFAPATQRNLGKRWEDDLPRLRRTMEAARTEAELLVALSHFGNSLHDVHCTFRPARRLPRKTLGFTASVEAPFQFYVESIQDASLGLVAGDVIDELDGVPATRFLEELDVVSNQNHRENVALDIAAWLSFRRNVAEETAARLVVRPRAGGPTRTLDLAWKKRPSGDDGPIFKLDYDNKNCLDNDPRSYGPYALTARGSRLCIYTSTAPTFRDYPIVRQVSFAYDQVPHGVLADWELVRSNVSKAKGVILDVQDNHGGINPNFFLDWWAEKPWVDTFTFTRLDPTLLRGPDGEPNISSPTPALLAWYAEELAHAKEGQRFTSARPFMCKPDTCTWDNRYEPKHRVTKAPVALLLGPDCASTCDAVAYHFARQKIGPVVGRPSMAGFTTHRAHFDVVLRPHEKPLGTLDLAISFDTTGSTDPADNIEGVPIPLDAPVPRTFENHGKHDALMVEKAIQLLARR